jgi:hypothetical protein
MKKFKYILFALLIIVGNSCSKDDENTTENGVNKAPNQKPTGRSANDFLSANNYESLVIEVSYAENLRPNTQSLLNLKQFLEARLNKPTGISIIEKQISTQAGSPFSVSEINTIENSVRTKYNDVNVLTLHLLFLNGDYIDDTATSKVLGVAYRNTSCVLFETAIQTLSNQLNEPSRVDLETTVLSHEICHLLGLVDLGSSMQNNHIDNDHGKHCSNANCLMYWQVENNNVVGMMTSGNVPQLDANCILDLQANGGK